MDNKIDYQLGKDCFEKFLHELKDSGNDLSKEALDKTIHDGIEASSKVCAGITGVMVKHHVPYDIVNASSEALLDMIAIMKVATEATLIREMLYGKGDASDRPKS